VTVNLLPQIPPQSAQPTPPAKRNARVAASSARPSPGSEARDLSGRRHRSGCRSHRGGKALGDSNRRLRQFDSREERLHPMRSSLATCSVARSAFVIPFEAIDGHTLYRARFGMFAENEARDICKRMTQRARPASPRDSSIEIRHRIDGGHRMRRPSSDGRSTSSPPGQSRPI